MSLEPQEKKNSALPQKECYTRWLGEVKIILREKSEAIIIYIKLYCDF
jgi:hypothetical protein